MQKSITIPKDPKLSESSDYTFLRSKGLEYIQQLGSQFWTDYNAHDPGITMLEALCYAITDLGYRTSLNIKDLMADVPGVAPANKYNFDKQAFFTAREILTINPCTVNDFRKLLIDIEGVKNAWLSCRQCPCNDLFLYANCAESVLQYEYKANEQVIIRGMYDVQIEFEDEERSGNLNSGKIWYNFSFLSGANYTVGELEVRLPSWAQLQKDIDKYRDIREKEIEVTGVKVEFISANKNDDKDIPDVPDTLLDNALKKPLFATITVTYVFAGDDPANTHELKLADTPVTVWLRSGADRRSITLPDIKTAMEDKSASGIIKKFIEKTRQADAVIAQAARSLHSHRNLCEDYCSIGAIEVEDIAVCADMDVKPGADIEQVLANAYFLIDEYFSPTLQFHSLKELLKAGKPVDEIFEGPQLNNGFLDTTQLETTNLKKVIYTSDIINLLMNIEGVVSVRNLVLTRYDNDGNVAMKVLNGKLVADIEDWSMPVTVNRQPRLYVRASKILVFKNGLPFLPDSAEFLDTLQVVKGTNAQPKFSIAENNLPVPLGEWYDLQAYYPVEYSLPITYGIGYEGLPSTATETRKAQAKQLKAYMLFFEQMLVNYLQQLTHVKDLFAVDKSIVSTYFSQVLNDNDIAEISQVYKGVTPAQLADIVSGFSETETVQLDRRNRFLDHLLARFSEQFTDYALMLYSYINDKAIADKQLISNKIDFIQSFPFLSSNRGRSFNYKDEAAVCLEENISGLQKRAELLLGLNDFGYMNYFDLYAEKDSSGNLIDYRWDLVDSKGKVYLSSSKKHKESSFEEFTTNAKKELAIVYQHFTDATKYLIKKDTKWTLVLQNEAGEVIAKRRQQFKTQKDAKDARDRIVNYAKKVTAAEKLFLVEHVLLRPRSTRIQPFLFEVYEEKDTDGVVFERRWRLIDENRKIYLSSSTRYFDTDINDAWEKAKAEIKNVCLEIGNKDNYTIKFKRTWHIDMVLNGEVIATRIEKFDTEAEAQAARDKIIERSKTWVWDGDDAGQLMMYAGTDETLFGRDPLLPVCLSGDCSPCEETDPYSFRFTIVVNGEDGMANNDIEFRRFAEETIRLETPAHLGLKICWVSKKQLLQFADVWCSWRTELAKKEPDPLALHEKLSALLEVFTKLKNVYPPATLHDCIDGNDDNRVYLDNTII